MPETLWFVYCEDTSSHEVLVHVLRGFQKKFDYSEHDCADGVKRPLYQMPEQKFALDIYKSQTSINARLTIFRMEDNHPPEEWKPEELKRSTVQQLIERSNRLKARKRGGKKYATRF